MSKIERQENKVTIQPGQDIVASMVEEFKKELQQLCTDEISGLAIDFSGTSNIDSMGLSVLVATHNSLQKRNLSLEVIHVPDNILKLLKDMRLNQHFICQQ